MPTSSRAPPPRTESVGDGFLTPRREQGLALQSRTNVCMPLPLGEVARQSRDGEGVNTSRDGSPVPYRRHFAFL